MKKLTFICARAECAQEFWDYSSHPYRKYCSQSCRSLVQSVRHGQNRVDKRTRTYGIWASMIQRTTNPNCTNYERYGAAGRGVDEQWLKFENFFADMGECPEGLTIDRIDTTKGYFPDNCRWATPLEQGRNSLQNHLLTHRGKTQCISMWLEEGIGLCRETIRQRMLDGWDDPFVLGVPVALPWPPIEFNGVTQSIGRWAKATGLSSTLIRLRIHKYNWSVERALTTPADQRWNAYK